MRLRLGGHVVHRPWRLPHQLDFNLVDPVDAQAALFLSPAQLGLLKTMAPNSGFPSRADLQLKAAMARALDQDRAAAAAGKILPVLLQINAGDDPAKFGVSCAEAPALLEIAMKCPALKVEGLMTIAPLAPENPTVAQKCFARLRETRDELVRQYKITLPELSMGMTDDLEAAVKEGSTLIRVGSALFGKRE